MSEIIQANYDGFSLTTAPFSMTEWPYTGAPVKNTKTYDIAREHGQKRAFVSYDSPVITVSGLIDASSREELDAYIDLFKSWTRRDKGTFTVDYGIGIRLWDDAIVKTFNIDRAPRDLSRTPWSLTLELESPFAKDGNVDTIATSLNITTASLDIGLNIGGTMDGEPDISFEVVAFNPTNAPKTIIVSNPSASQYLSINRVWAVGDVVNIDCQNRLVYVNGTAFYAAGQFPSFAVGPGLMQFSDDATSRDILLTATNERRFL